MIVSEKQIHESVGRPMKHPSLRIEGPILSMDIVDRIAEGDFPG